jgi:glycosyltransferase involved in cell wall biosynthesis
MNGQIAVVIPAYRCEKVIAETLDSVKTQQRKADIVVVVLDEPNPEIEAVCRDHELNIEIIINPCNLGVGATRNIGFRHVQDRVDFICFLDSDDILHPGFIRMAYAQFKAMPEADGVFGAFAEWYHGTPRPQLSSLTAESVSILDKPLDTYFSNTGRYILSFALLKTSSIKAVAVDGKVNIETLRNNQDFEFISRLFFKGSIVRIEDRCGWYRKIPDSLSYDQPRAWGFRADASKLLYSWLKTHQAEKALLVRVKAMEHSAFRTSARLLWEKSDRKKATQLLLKSTAELQWKSFAQLIMLATGVLRLVQRFRRQPTSVV